MKIICMGTFKGGVGKTMSAFNIAGILASRGFKILVVDMDPQGNLTNNFGIDRTLEGFKSIKDILEANENFDNVVIKHPVEELETLDILPSSIFLVETELTLFNRANRESILKNYIEDNKDKFGVYDYIIIDTNPSMGILNQNAFLVSDKINLVTDVDMNALEGVQLFMALWERIRSDLRIEDNVGSVLINNFEKRTNIAKDFLEYCRGDNDISKLLLETIIPHTVTLKDSTLAAKPINIYNDQCPGYVAFNNLVDEMIGREIL